MKLKKLLPSETVQSVPLTLDEGFFLIEKKGGEKLWILMEISAGESKFPEKLDEEIENFRFIGGERVFQEFSRLGLDWEDKLQKKIILETSTTLHFYPDGRLRYEAQLGEKTLASQAAPVQSPVLQEKGQGQGRKKKVLIVDDSRTIRKLLSRIIGEAPDLEVLACVEGPLQAREYLKLKKPDLITLDIHMPEMNGVEFLKSDLMDSDIPVVMISSVSPNEGPLIFEALSSGASTYIQKPTAGQINKVKDDILRSLRAVAGVKKTETGVIQCISAPQFSHFEGLIAIGSSTGGTQALQSVFTALPPEIPPIVVVQHIPAVFSKALAERLNGLCPFDVVEAEDGQFLEKNRVYIAPGGRQMKVLRRGKELKLEINDDDPVNQFQPSVDYLFESIAQLGLPRVLGLILTGMGKDGAKGLLSLKNAGAETIAQDKKSSVVFGMPAEAIRIGAADSIVCLSEIPLKLVSDFDGLRLKKIA